MTSATLHIPKVNTSIELTPELTEYIVDAIENYKEARSDTLLRGAIRANPHIAVHTDRLRSLHATGEL